MAVSGVRASRRASLVCLLTLVTWACSEEEEGQPLQGPRDRLVLDAGDAGPDSGSPGGTDGGGGSAPDLGVPSPGPDAGALDSSIGDGGFTDAGGGGADAGGGADGGGADAGGGDGGIPSSGRRLTDLSPAEGAALCQRLQAETEARFAMRADELCRLVAAVAVSAVPGLPESQRIALCEAALAECEPSAGNPDTCVGRSEAPTCDLTVADLLACHADSLMVVDNLLAPFERATTCAEIIRVSVPFPAEPASCARLAMRCPDALPNP